MYEKYKAKIITEEGLIKKVYKDTLGFLTFGVGHNIEDNPIPPHILATLLNGDITLGISQLLSHDLHSVIHSLDTYLKWWDKLPSDAKIVLVDMCFNLGIKRLLRFRKMIKHLKNSEWEKASSELMKSRYSKQVPNRARRNRDLLFKLKT